MINYQHPNYVQVEGHPDLVKDKANGAVLSTNVEALEEYRLVQAKRNQIADLPVQVQELKAQVDRMETMFGMILQKLDERS